MAYIFTKKSSLFKMTILLTAALQRKAPCGRNRSITGSCRLKSRWTRPFLHPEPHHVEYRLIELLNKFILET